VKGSVSKESVVQCQWGYETQEFGIKKVENPQISTIKKY